MAAVKEKTIELKLKTLFELQRIHTKLDAISIMKGELPMEVTDLEDEITGLGTRLSKLEDEIKDFDHTITGNQNKVQDCELHIKKYNKQLNNVKNNREYDALTKEIDMQRLEMQLLDKRSREATESIESRKSYLKESKKAIKEKDAELEIKRKELSKIIKETEKEEKELEKSLQKLTGDIEERLLNAFNRVRKTYKNGLGVVKYDRDACGGCFAHIPPQRQLEIRQRKKILVCEHCGRIIVDPEIGS